MAWRSEKRADSASEATEAPRLDVTKFGIWFCPGCRRLRDAASQCCVCCGIAATVIANA